MIKSTKITLKFSNRKKLENISTFVDEYRRVLFIFVNQLWNITDVKCLLPKEITDTITDSWLSSRAIQCAGKQASGIVRGAKKKQSKRLYQINKFKSLGQFKKMRKLQKIYDSVRVSKPNITVVNPELDSRFVNIELNESTSFDGWITLSSLGNKLKIVIPFKKHKHFNSMLDRGILKTGVRLSKSELTLMFELSEPTTIETGKIIGIDIGQKTTLTCSDGQMVEADKHGHTYQTICKKLSRKKKDSKNFRQAEKHRSNYIHWSVNQLNLDGIKKVNLENIKHLRKGRRTSRLMSHWNYAELFDKLETKLNDAGVQINKVSPTYTSQRCSACGWVRGGNRKGKQFRCDKCSFECDADLNGSLNISFDLPSITKEERLSHKNRNGFYWSVIGEAPTVPHIQKTNDIFQYNL
jgi:IS605 OrfB family transposase